MYFHVKLKPKRKLSIKNKGKCNLQDKSISSDKVSTYIFNHCTYSIVYTNLIIIGLVAWHASPEDRKQRKSQEMDRNAMCMMHWCDRLKRVQLIESDQNCYAGLVKCMAWLTVYDLAQFTYNTLLFLFVFVYYNISFLVTSFFILETLRINRPVKNDWIL